MRRRLLLAGVVLTSACGGGGSGVDAGETPIDAQGTVVDGVLVFVDAPPPDATSATTGAIMLTIQCGGSVCGKTGHVKIAVDDCMGGATVSSKTLLDKTLAAGSDVVTTIDTLDPGAYCATAYLDVNMNFTLDAGDATASAGPAKATVVAGQVVAATTVLDTIQQ